MITKPMLAGKVGDTSALRYPVIASPKIDGIRCLKLDGKVLARSLKPIPNEHICNRLSSVPDGFDGELLVGDSFQACTSGIMSRDGDPAFTYHVFDWALAVPYRERLEELKNWFRGSYHPALPFLRYVPTQLITTEAQLLAYEEKCLADGYEGVMVRDPTGPYKCGRSTEKEGWLLKLKRFTDGEAVVLACIEQLHNTNAQEVNELGRAKRSSAKAGKVPAGALGAFQVRDLSTGVEFEVGTGVGLTAELRAQIWAQRDAYVGRLITYRSQPYGVKDKPRLPVWLGFRDKRDM